MLVLTRKSGEELIIDGCIRVKVIDSRGGRIKLGIEAPRNVRVTRQELLEEPRECHDHFAEFEVADESLVHEISAA